MINLNHSKMKTKLNIALEGTCNGDVVGGLLLWAGENLQALLFWKGGGTTGRKRNGLPERSFTQKDSPKHNPYLLR